MKKILIFSFLFCTNLWACGEYQVRALVSMENGRNYLLINPGTLSEIKIKVDFNEGAKLSPYIDRNIETTIMISSRMDHSLGETDTLGKISVIAPDPLRTNKGTFLKEIKKEDCRK